MTTRRRKWYHPRFGDIVALVGLIGFVAQIVDRYVSGAPGDPTLASFCVLLAMGTPLERVLEVVAQRNDRP